MVPSAFMVMLPAAGDGAVPGASATVAVVAAAPLKVSLPSTEPVLVPLTTVPNGSLTASIGGSMAVASDGVQRDWVAPDAGQVASPPPLTRAVLVTLPVVPLVTATVSVIGLPDAPLAMASVLVQVTVGAVLLQAQPAPVAET